MSEQPTPAKIEIYPTSVVEDYEQVYFLGREPSGERLLGVRCGGAGFTQPLMSVGEYAFYPLTAQNAAELRRRLPWLKPTALGTFASFGFGDRLGLGTPGHVRAARDFNFLPVFAQQSQRENERTGRSPQEVVDDAMWGLFQEGWRTAWGADADHLKRVGDVPAFVRAGYSFYTVDPCERLDATAADDPPAVLKRKMTILPWEALHSSPEEQYRLYLGKSVPLPGGALEIDETALLRTAATCARAIAHTAAMFNAIGEQCSTAFDFELSLDEGAVPTSPLEHYYAVAELRRLGVKLTSLAPRFAGRFEKGVEFIGEKSEFVVSAASHALVARHFGGYRLSLHSGSDKFSIHPLLAEACGGVMHVKTAGTSYLEGLRVAARREPELMRAILGAACEAYPTARATYHVSAQVEKVAAAAALPDDDLPGLLDDFHARQVLHVTYGEVLERFGGVLKECLGSNAGEYAAALQAHLTRHLRALSA